MLPWYMNDIKKENYNYKPQRQACYLRTNLRYLNTTTTIITRKDKPFYKRRELQFKKQGTNPHIYEELFSKTINNNTESITILEEQTKKWKICKDLLYTLVVSCHQVMYVSRMRCSSMFAFCSLNWF